jgi:hypothetical protein
MQELDFLFGLNQLPVQSVFNALLRFFFQSEHLRQDQTDLIDCLLNPDDPDRQTELVSAQTVLRHAEFALRTLSLQSNAFLVENQKLLLSQFRQELFDDWQMILSAANLKSSSCAGTERENFLRIDALFLCQLEWMRDVGFLDCEPALRRLIFSECPLSEFFTLEK